MKQEVPKEVPRKKHIESTVFKFQVLESSCEAETKEIYNLPNKIKESKRQ